MFKEFWLKRKKYLLAGGAALVLLGLLRAFSGGEEEVSYLIEVARVGDIVKTVNATGEVAAVQLVDVGAQVSGQIKTLHVKVGQKVTEGELIAEIDSITQQNELDTNRARLATYESQLVSRQVALKVAQTQYERELELKARKATSEENLENAENALESAKAAVDEMESLIVQTRISVDTAETNLGYTRIVSPLTGTILSVAVEQGQTVNANQTTPTIAQIADLSQMEVRMQISEGDVTKVKPGMEVQYTILSEPDRVFTGVLNSVDPGLTTLSDGSYEGSIEAGTAVYYYGKLLADNKDGSLRIGMTTQNTITIGEARGVLVVPSIAVTQHEGRSFVRVMEKKKPVEREIETGLSDNMYTEVISGLSEGDEVVAAQMTAEEMAASLASGGGRRGPRL